VLIPAFLLERLGGVRDELEEGETLELALR
jgi:hypothetical protein